MRVGQLLTKGRFASLQMVIIYLSGGNDKLRTQMNNYLREKLGVLCRRKMLRCGMDVKGDKTVA